MPSLRDRVDVVVEAGFRGASVGGFTWDVSDWDSGADWGGVEPTWVALDGWTVERADIRRGRDRANRRHPAGTATVTLVYRTPADVWSFVPTSPVALGQEIRLRVRPRGLDGEPLTALLPLYRGAIRSLQDRWTPATPERPATFRIVVNLVDRLADLGAVDNPELGSAVGLDDTTSARLERILTMAAIDTYYLRGPHGAALPAGVVHHASGTFARNLLDEAQVAVESETGELYVDREGFIVFRERLGTGSYARENAAQLTWANDADPDAVAPSAFGTAQNLDDVVNQVSRARTGGTAYTATDGNSQLRYGLRTDQRFDLTCRYDADVEYAADYWLAQLKDRTQRIEGVERELDASMSDAQLEALLDVEIGDRHDVRWTDYVTTLEGQLHVQGIRHAIGGADGRLSWTVGVDLWAYAGEGLEPPVARWGTAIWGTDVWSS